MTENVPSACPSQKPRHAPKARPSSRPSPRPLPGTAAPTLEAPTPERQRRAPVALVAERDAAGWPVSHYRALDPLERMVRSGLIEAAWAAAGARFRRDFHHAQFDPLSASDLRRARGAGGREAIADRVEDARQRVWEALQSLGGSQAPAGSAIWHVIGNEMSLRDWALRQIWGGGRSLRHDVATGILVGALGALAGHYSRPRAQLQRGIRRWRGE